MSIIDSVNKFKEVGKEKDLLEPILQQDSAILRDVQNLRKNTPQISHEGLFKRISSQYKNAFSSETKTALSVANIAEDTVLETLEKLYIAGIQNLTDRINALNETLMGLEQEFLAFEEANPLVLINVSIPKKFGKPAQFLFHVNINGAKRSITKYIEPSNGKYVLKEHPITKRAINLVINVADKTIGANNAS